MTKYFDVRHRQDDPILLQKYEQLLLRDPLPIVELSHLARKHAIPSSKRSVIWRILLRVSPRASRNEALAKEHHEEIFRILFHSLHTMRLIQPVNFYYSNSTSITNGNLTGISSGCQPEAEHYVLMWLLYHNLIDFSDGREITMPENQCLVYIARKMRTFYNNPAEAYQVCRALWDKLQNKEKDIRKVIEEAIGVLRHVDHTLHVHLLQIGVFSSSLLKDLCSGLFCEMLSTAAFEIIMDKVVAYEFEFLSCILITFFKHLRDELLSSHTLVAIRNTFLQLDRNDGYVLIKSTLCKWEKSGNVHAFAKLV